MPHVVQGEVVMPILFSSLVRTWHGLAAKHRAELRYLNSLSSREDAQCPGMVGGCCLAGGRQALSCGRGGKNVESAAHQVDSTRRPQRA